MRLCIRNGLVLSPGNKVEAILDLWIENGKIARMERAGSRDSKSKRREGTLEIDAAGKWVAPGLIDLHVHFREPGQTHKEDIASGCLAAARGGFTTVCCMPNTNPPLDRPEVLALVDEKGRQGCGVNLLPVCAVTLGQKGETPVDLATLAAMETRCRELTGRGVAAISEDGRTVVDSRVMAEAMKTAKELGVPVFSHTEDHFLSGGAMHEGAASALLGIPGIPAEGEEIIVARDMLLSKYTGCPLHFCHISTRGSLDLIRLGKSWGLPITAETGPHYFTLTDEDVGCTGVNGGQSPVGNPNRKMNPPLRTREDREAVKRALADGTLSAIATDHAPHHASEKAEGFQKAPFGVTGLETSFAVSYTHLVKTGVLTPWQLVEKMSTGPADILGLKRGRIEEGAAADLAVIDVSRKYVIAGSDLISKGKNTPFEGMEVYGKVEYTIAGGKIIYQDKEQAQ